MSLLLHVIGKVIVFSVLGAIVLALLTWFTKNERSGQPPRASEEWPEDKATHVNRISVRRSYSASRQALKDEQERRRA